MLAEKTLTHEDARRALDAMASECASKGLKAVLAVADNHGELIGLLRLAGAPLASIQIAANKAYTSARERKPSRAVGQASRDPANGFEMAYFGDRRFTGWGGAVPVLVGGECAGAVAASGLTEDADIELAEIGVKAVLEGTVTRS